MIESLLGRFYEEIQNQSLINDQIKLVQENDTGISSTDTIKFIPRRLVLKDKKVIYARIVYNCQFLIEEIIYLDYSQRRQITIF